MADPQTLINFVDWAEKNYPADEYGLIIWNHGAGWGKGDMITKGGISDETDNDFMSGGAGEWREAILGARQQIGQDFYFIGHDLCVMAYMEVLWDEYDIAEMIVGSEANEPFDGWYYNNFITALATSNPTTHAELGAKIVDDYASYYGGSAATMTYNVINDVENFNGISNGEFYKLKNHIFYLAKSLIENDGGRDDADVQACIDAAVEMSGGTFYEDFKDLWSFCDLLTTNVSIHSTTKAYADSIKVIIDKMNPYDWQNGFNGSHGLGIYLPDDNNIYYFEEPYHAETHPWGASDLYNGTTNGACPTWTNFIYGSTVVSLEEEIFPENQIVNIMNPTVYYENGLLYYKGTYKLAIFDITGREIYNEINYTKSNNVLNISNYRAGIYFIKADNDLIKIIKIK